MSGPLPAFTLLKGGPGLKPVLTLQNFYQTQTGPYRTGLCQLQVSSKTGLNQFLTGLGLKTSPTVDYLLHLITVY